MPNILVLTFKFFGNYHFSRCEIRSQYQFQHLLQLLKNVQQTGDATKQDRKRLQWQQKKCSSAHPPPELVLFKSQNTDRRNHYRFLTPFFPYSCTPAGVTETCIPKLPDTGAMCFLMLSPSQIAEQYLYQSYTSDLLLEYYYIIRIWYVITSY